MKIDKALIKVVKDVCLVEKQIKIYVKDHPILPLKKITSLKNIPNNLVLTRQNLENLLKKSLISITSGPTSAIQESYNMNNFLILPDIEVGTKINSLRLKLNSKNVFITKNTEQFISAVKMIKKNKNKFKKNSINFFEELTKKNIRIFY